MKYQLLIIFLIAGATGLGVVLSIAGGIWRLTDERHRLRLDRLGGERGCGGVCTDLCMWLSE